MAFAWEARVHRFRDLQTGRFLAYRSIRQGVDAVANASSQHMVTVTQHLREGTISVLDWEQEMRRSIKLNELANVMAAHGGRSAMTPSDWGYAGSQIRAQYQYLQQFAADIVSGQQPANGRMVARAAMYGQHGRTTFEQTLGRDVSATGTPMEERNVLGSGDPCSQCPELSAMGWVPAGTLPLPGNRLCLAHCKCHIDRRRARARVLAEAG